MLNCYVLLDADFAWTHARYAEMDANEQAGNQIPNAVGKVASLAVTLHHLGPWSAQWNTRYIGSYPLSQDGLLRAPSAIVSNVRLQRELTPRLSLALNILNLFNRPYYDIAYRQDYRVTPTAAVVPAGITVHPGEPREFRLTLNYQL